jgi:hypothetical protein
MKLIKLSAYAKLYNVTYRTAWNWYKAGKIHNIVLTPSNKILVGVEDDDVKYLGIEEDSTNENKRVIRLCVICNLENKSCGVTCSKDCRKEKHVKHA